MRAKSCEITGGCCGLAQLSFGFIFHPSSRGAPLIVSLGEKTLGITFALTPFSACSQTPK